MYKVNMKKDLVQKNKKHGQMAPNFQKYSAGWGQDPHDPESPRTKLNWFPVALNFNP